MPDACSIELCKYVGACANNHSPLFEGDNRRMYHNFYIVFGRGENPLNILIFILF